MTCSNDPANSIIKDLFILVIKHDPSNNYCLLDYLIKNSHNIQDKLASLNKDQLHNIKNETASFITNGYLDITACFKDSPSTICTPTSITSDSSSGLISTLIYMLKAIQNNTSQPELDGGTIGPIFSIILIVIILGLIIK